jgi:hypothetical protein
LEKLSCVPFVSFHVENGTSAPIHIAGKKAGSLDKPDIDVILKHSKPSPFGKGSKTVMDETYRRGREIVADKIDFPDSDYDLLESEIAKVVNAMLFVPRRVELKLYKLAVYRKGGHFDWHMDSTHSDRHHATVLVALCTSWTGGDLILRRNGVETRVDMKPKRTKPCDYNFWNRETVLGAVAFYTDTEHKVEPVTDGVRIVLQYDVEVKDWSDKKETEVKSTQEEKDEAKDKDTKPETSDDDDDDDGDDEDEDMGDESEHSNEEEDAENDSDDMDVYRSEGTLRGINDVYRRRKTHENTVLTNDPAFADEVANIIGGILKSGQDEVAFALQYLYRKSSILPEFLKGSDSLLYHTLAKTFDVSLYPIVLHEATDYEGMYGSSDSAFAYKFEHGRDAPSSGVEYEDIKVPEFSMDKSEDTGERGQDEEVGEDEDEHKKEDDEEEIEEDDEDENIDEDDEDEAKSEEDEEPQTKKTKAIFYIPRSSALEQISHQSYVEYTGNEAILGEDKYFGGGMFVRRKDTTLDDKSV